MCNLRQAFFPSSLIFPCRFYSTIAPCSCFTQPTALRYNVSSWHSSTIKLFLLSPQIRTRRLYTYYNIFLHSIIHITKSRVKRLKWSRYRPGVAQKVGRGIALLFHDRGTRKEVSGQQHAPAALYPWERTGTHFTGGWVDPKVGLDWGKISSPPGFDPGPSSP